MPPDTDNPVANLAASLAEFDNPSGTPPEPSIFDGTLDIPLMDPEKPQPAEPVKQEPDPAKQEPEPAATEPGPVTDPDDDFPDEPPAPGDKSKKGWKEVKGELKKTRAELREERDKAAAELKARDEEIARLREQVVKLPDYEERAKYAEEAERELAIARFEGTREYKETVKAPMEAIEAAAETLAKANDVKVDDMLDALAQRDPVKRREMLKDIISGMDVVDQQEVLQMAKDTQQLLAKHDAMRARAVEARKEAEELAGKRSAEEKARAARELGESIKHTVAELRKRVPFVETAAGETADAVFEAVLKDAGATDFDNMNLSTKAYSAVAGVLLKRATKQLVHLVNENKALKARIEEANSAMPSVGAGGTATPPSDDGDLLASTGRFLGLDVSRPKLE